MSVTAPVANAMSKFQANTSLTPRAVFAPPPWEWKSVFESVKYDDGIQPLMRVGRGKWEAFGLPVYFAEILAPIVGA